MKKIDVEILSKADFDRLLVEVGNKMRTIIDGAIDSHKEKTGEALKFSHKISTKLKLSKNKEDTEIARLENEINKELNKLVKQFGIKTQLTLVKE